MKAKRATQTHPPSNVITFPGCAIVEYCRPVQGNFKLYYAETEYMMSAGIRPGMVVVGRPLARDVRPAHGSVVVVRFEDGGELFIVRSIDSDEQGVTLADDLSEQEYQHDELIFEAVALYACSCDLIGGGWCERVYFEAPSVVDECFAKRVM